MRLTTSQLNEIRQILHALCKIGCNICSYHNNYDKCMNYITFRVDEIVKIVSHNPHHSDHSAFVTSTGHVCVSWLSASRSSYHIVYQPIDRSAPFGGRTSRNFILSEDNIKNLINTARASLHEELFPDAPAPEPLVFDGNYDMSLDDILVEECGCLPLYNTDCGNWPLRQLATTASHCRDASLSLYISCRSWRRPSQTNRAQCYSYHTCNI